MAALRTDLEGVEELLDEKPMDPENIIGSMEQRERQVEELQNILPKLGMYDTDRIAARSRSLSND